VGVLYFRTGLYVIQALLHRPGGRVPIKLIVRVLAVFVSAWTPERTRGFKTMAAKTQDWAACRRRELERDRDSRRRSEATAAKLRLNARRTGCARVKADPFGPRDPRFGYLARSYD
jgi:hypothetical protein